MPFLTIITITYNAGKFLDRTLKSVDRQVFKDFEYLLIDGNSDDDTLKIAKSYEHLFDSIISEPDKGLYDAMNKGLKLATGEFVWFLNAGDEIADGDVCKNLHKICSQNADVVYGETIFTDLEGNKLGVRSELTPHKLPDTLSWEDMKYGMLVCHQSFIARKEISPTFLQNNLSADIDWEIKILKSSRKTINYHGIISKYLIGGISNQQLSKSLIDRFSVLKSHFGLVQTMFAHVHILSRGVKKMMLNGGKYW